MHNKILCKIFEAHGITILDTLIREHYVLVHRIIKYMYQDNICHKAQWWL